MILPTLNQVKIGIAALALLASIGYVVKLNFTISEQNTNIAILQNELITQNAAVNVASIEQKNLQEKLKDSDAKNKKTKAEFEKLMHDLNDRPVINTCIEALDSIKHTSDILADKWNTR